MPSIVENPSPFFSENKVPPQKPERDLIWEEKLKRMARGLPPSKSLFTKEQREQMVRDAELLKRQDMKRAGQKPGDPITGEDL